MFSDLIPLFLRLMVAHQIADFPLQTNWVFRIRQRYPAGSLLHVAIHLLITAVLMIPYATNWHYWVMLLTLGVTHYFIDLIKKPNIWMFFLDQLLHSLVMVGQAYLLLTCSPMLLPPEIISYWSNDVYWIWLLSALLATFTSTILLYFIKMTWRKDYRGRGIFGFEKYTGASIRFLTYVIVSISVCYAQYYLIIVAILIPLIQLVYIDRHRGEKPHYRDLHISDVILGTLLAALLGLWAGLV